MDEAIPPLRELQAYYKAKGKLLHAHVINNAIRKLEKHGRQQKAKEEVPSASTDARPVGVRVKGHEADDTGSDTCISYTPARVADEAGQGSGIAP